MTQPATPILIEGARCFDGTKLLPGKVDIYLEGGRIGWVGSGSAPSNARRIKAGDAFVAFSLKD